MEDYNLTLSDCLQRVFRKDCLRKFQKKIIGYPFSVTLLEKTIHKIWHFCLNLITKNSLDFILENQITVKNNVFTKFLSFHFLKFLLNLIER